MQRTGNYKSLLKFTSEFNRREVQFIGIRGLRGQRARSACTWRWGTRVEVAPRAAWRRDVLL